jgi:hypothetical protein
MKNNGWMSPPSTKLGPSGLVSLSTDILLIVAGLGAAALSIVVVALFAPVALVLFAASGAAGLKHQAPRWRVAETF